MENKIWRNVYLMHNPIQIKHQQPQKLQLKNTILSPLQNENDQPSSMDLSPATHEQKQNNLGAGQKCLLLKQCNRNAEELVDGGLGDGGLLERIKELQRKSVERQIQYGKLKLAFQMEKEKKYQQSRDQRVCQLNLLEKFIEELEQYESKRMVRKMMASSKKPTNEPDQMCSSTQSKNGLKKTLSQTEQQSEVDQKSLILAITKQLHYLYTHLPDQANNSSSNHRFHSIFNSNQQIFIDVVNNRIKLNTILDL